MYFDLFLIFISVKSNGACRNDSDDKSGKVQYVLVNEDEGSTFNNRNYNLGNDFVSLVNQDQKDSGALPRGMLRMPEFVPEHMI